jgi:hypothetical protein
MNIISDKMGIQDMLTSDEPPSIGMTHFCLGIGYLSGYGNSTIIKVINDTYVLEKPKKTSPDEKLSSKMYAAGLCWLYDKTIQKI